MLFISCDMIVDHFFGLYITAGERTWPKPKKFVLKNILQVIDLSIEMLFKAVKAVKRNEIYLIRCTHR